MRLRLSPLAFILAVVSSEVARSQTASASLDSLLRIPVSAASRYRQNATRAPASVTIVTSDEIRQHGYGSLDEILESVRGFYVSNDHNYTYLGARGFGRPTDYNNRILLQVDGHAINDQTWSGAPIGTELPINVDAIDRIEIVRGPGSALYGTGAMFGVVNIITKTGTQLHGAHFRATAGPGGHRELALSAGRALGATGSVAISAVSNRLDGDDLYFPEMNTPAQNNGVASGLDWERASGFLASAAWQGWSARAGTRSRSKGIPTASYGTVFGDSRAETWDRTVWVSLAVERRLHPHVQLTGRIHGTAYDYEGTYPFDGGTAWRDGGASRDASADVMMVADPTSRNRLSVGGEVRRVTNASYWEREVDGTFSSDDQPFDVLSAFAQNELQLTSRLTLVAGVRHDAKFELDRSTTPRVALIVAPDERTTAKLLYGSAFRSPSPAEATITTSYYQRNPGLRQERIRTAEIEVQRRLADPVLLGVSLYRYGMRDLIEQTPPDSTGSRFDNIASVAARGGEIQLDVVANAALSTRVTYALQQAEDRLTGRRLTNSPEHIASGSILARGRSGFRSAATLRYESGRRTLSGPATRAFTRTDVSVGYEPPTDRAPSWLAGTAVSLRASNVFDVTYAVPAGVEHVQSALPQHGRHLTLRLDWRP